MKKVCAVSVMVLVVFAGCVSKGAYNLKEEEVMQLSIHIDDLEQEKENLEGRIALLGKDKEGLHELIETISKEKESEITRLNATYRNLVTDMKDEIKKGEITITRLKDKLTVNLVDKIIFPTGKATLKMQGKKVLSRIGEILKDVAEKQIRIEGHTDNVPIGRALRKKFPTNWELSAARATNVARFFIDTVGLDKHFISVGGYADNKPIDTNETKEGRANNRRIEILLIPLETE